MNKALVSICGSMNWLTRLMDWLSPAVLLVIRLYFLDVFFRSGWLKLHPWQSTVALFKYEYKVWLVSPETAAVIGTAAELILPIFLALGLGARLPALLLFIFNIIMVFTYPYLLSPEGACALKDHILWGVLIAWIMFNGHGKLSLDYLLQSKVCKEYKY
jgi:putative oxidoreductase